MTIGKPHPLSLAKYEIQSDLLYELLTYSDGLPTRLGFSNWNVDHSDARPMMTLIAMRAFDLYRLPWHHDRCFSIPAPDPARLTALACVTDAMLRRLLWSALDDVPIQKTCDVMTSPRPAASSPLARLSPEA